MSSIVCSGDWMVAVVSLSPHIDTTEAWSVITMQVGILKETKDKEHRVALTPVGAKTLHQAGHTVLVQAGAGLGAGFSDAYYLAAGARVVPVEQAWDAELVLKVKEPLASEYHYLKEQILFTYFHLAGGPQALTKALLRQHTTAVAYETVEDAQGTLPLLAPDERHCGQHGHYHWQLLSGQVQQWQRYTAWHRPGHTLWQSGHHWRWGRRPACCQNCRRHGRPGGALWPAA
jgi:hypothetical protein